MLRRFFSLILIVSLSLAVFSCEKDEEPKYEYCEIGIDLADDYRPYDSEGAFNAAYTDDSSIVGIVRISYADCASMSISAAWTPRMLADYFLAESPYSSLSSVEMRGVTPYYTYTEVDENGDEYFAIQSFYRTEYAYVVITFITSKAREEAGRYEFLRYIDSVYILPEYIL